jgi:hypothetical protein
LADWLAGLDLCQVGLRDADGIGQADLRQSMALTHIGEREWRGAPTRGPRVNQLFEAMLDLPTALVSTPPSRPLAGLPLRCAQWGPGARRGASGPTLAGLGEQTENFEQDRGAVEGGEATHVEGG